MNTLRKITKIRELSSLLFLVVLFGTVGLFNSDFLSAESLLNSLNDSVVFTMLACGIAFTIFTGEIDVSIGATLGLSAAVTSSLLKTTLPPAVAILVGILVGALIGLFNGWGVAVLNIPSLIFTLGTMGVIRGFIFVYTNGAWIENLPKWFTNLSLTTTYKNLGLFYVCVFVLVIACFFILRTKKGKYFIAVGDNAPGAVLVGIPANKVKVLAYVLCGIFAALAGILYSSRIGFITPMAGNGYEMKAIAACVLGGISLTGGLGSLLGASIGAIIISSVGRILVFANFSSDYDNTITGILLITIVVIDALTQNRATVRNRRQRLMARTSGDVSSKG